jgi:SAM-dependent methyltransferase
MSKLWEYYGSRDPYYGVLSTAEFRADKMDDDAKARFFATGIQSVDGYIALAESKFGPLTFDTALDYGCGVGRLSRRLAQRFAQVISVDISESMLSLARNNIDAQNVTFENAARMGSTKADFMLSQMVFQHIPPTDGLGILSKLAARLRGTAIIELPIRDKTSSVWRMLRAAKRGVRAITPFSPPVIPMYAYEERAAIAALGDCRVIVERFDEPKFEYARLIAHH